MASKMTRRNSNSSDDNTVDTSDDSSDVHEPSRLFKRKKNTSPSRLTKISAHYDLDGDGVLNEAEQAMRDMDTTDRGYLTNEEIYEIVKLQLRSEKDKHRLKKVIVGLVCFIGILALSSLGTSFASAVLAKDAVADDETSTLRGTATGEVVGSQTAGDTFELEEMPEDVRRERRAMVMQQLDVDPHGAHNHRKLGKSNSKCRDGDPRCNGKIMFDNGMMPEEQFYAVQKKCESKKTVNIKRKFDDGSTRSDCICSPQSSIVVKPREGKSVGKKKKNNRKETDREVIIVTDGEEWFIDCTGDKCFSTGVGSLSGELGPCNLRFGDDDCRENLVCTDLGTSKKGKTGTCLYPQSDLIDLDVLIDTGNDDAILNSAFHGDGATCVLDLGYDACAYGFYCVADKKFRGQRKGICRSIPKKQILGQVCYQGHRNPCISGYSCRRSHNDGGQVAITAAMNGLCEADFIDDDDDDDFSTYKISKKRRKSQTCDVTYGRDACVSGYHCYSDQFSTSLSVTTGICTRIQGNGRLGDICELYQGSCANGFTCQSRSDLPYITYGFCTSSVATVVIEMNQPENSICDVTYDLRACRNGLVCYSGNGFVSSSQGICTRFGEYLAAGSVCSLSLGSNACAAGYHCVGNGRTFVNTGICTLNSDLAISNEGEWWIDWSTHQCVRDCERRRAPNCGGRKPAWNNELFARAQSCCETHLSWKNIEDCVPDWQSM